MSEAIKRFDPDVRYFSAGDYVGCMEAEADGEFVLYSDHAAEVERLRGLLEEAHSAIRWLYGYDEPNTPSFPICPDGKRYCWRRVGQEIEAVRRAIGEERE